MNSGLALSPGGTALRLHKCHRLCSDSAEYSVPGVRFQLYNNSALGTGRAPLPSRGMLYVAQAPHLSPGTLQVPVAAHDTYH